MEASPYADILHELRTQEERHPLSILKLAEPITTTPSATATVAEDQSRQQQSVPSSPSKSRSSDVSNSELAENATPASLEADLVHYKDLFSKLHFSYLEQVTKERFLRSIVADPPQIVSHADNLTLEASLAQQKVQLKTAKEEVDILVKEMETMARDIATKWEGVQMQMVELERLPREIEELQGWIGRMRQQQESAMGESGTRERSEDPRMNLSLEETEALVEQQKREAANLDKQIMALQGQIPVKTRECETAEKETQVMGKRRDEVSAAASAARKIKEEGGRDELEEKGRWYQASESVLKSLVDVNV